MSSETNVAGNSGDATDTALQVDGLGKCYHIYASPRHRLKQLASAITRRNYYREFWALRKIGFTVKRGQTVGIVGPNGSGKSTLLQLIAGILTPTEGVLRVKGRVAALLELGAGFNMEFTGRENVYMNAAILGFSKTEVDERFRAIQHFAEIGDFIDRPVKTYSSGMFVRLAFSVAVNVEPEILIVDEALAVGDIKFQARCFRKFEEFQSSGRTILFVSHSTEHIVRHCSHAILLYKGELLAQGEPRDISNRYMDLVFGMKADPEALAKKVKVAEEGAPTEQAESADPLAAFLGSASAGTFETRTGYNQLEYRWGDRTVEILDYLLKTSAGYHINHVESGDTVDLYVKVLFHKDVAQPVFGLTIKSIDGITLFSVNSKEWDARHEFRAAAAEQMAFVHFQFQVLLNSGDYLLSLGVAEDKHTEILPLDRRYDSIAIHVKALGRSHGIVTLPAKIEVLDRGDIRGE